MGKPTVGNSAWDSGMLQGTQEPNVNFRVVNHVAIISLNRPSALNALSHEMILELARIFERCRVDDDIVAVVLRGAGERAFCAGGDVRALQAMVLFGESEWLQFFVDEYRLDYTIHTFPKPVVALLDGITMGGGMGLGQGACLRVVTERTKMAMPETRIGLLPDVGATRFLAAMPIELELYVGLTGVTLSGGDACYCKLADACVPSQWLLSFEERLLHTAIPDKDGRVLSALRKVFEPPDNVVLPHSPLSELVPLVTRHFAERATVEEIVASILGDLEREKSDVARQWLAASVSALREHSPTMLKVTREALLRGRHLSLADCFRKELDMVSRAVREGDFREGVRAHLIDKDRRPSWLPATLEKVGEERVRQFCSSPWAQDAHPLAELGGG